MFAVAVSLFIAQRLQRDSVYEVGLARKGVRLERGRDVEVLEAMTVAEVMQTEASALRESDSLATAANALMRTRSHGLPVLNQDGELVGILTLQDLDRAQTEGTDAVQTVGQVCT